MALPDRRPGWERGAGRESRSDSSDGRKRKKKSPKVWVNYCHTCSRPFMWGEGLVQLVGARGFIGAEVSPLH